MKFFASVEIFNIMQRNSDKLKNTNLKTQQSWSTFSIGAVLTFVGAALKWETPEIYLLPIVLLLLISLKMRNYRQSMYMIARDETPGGFFGKLV